MISNFSEFNENDPLTWYLMSGDVDGVEIAEDFLKDKRKKLNASVTSELKFEYTGENILNGSQRRKRRARAGPASRRTRFRRR